MAKYNNPRRTWQYSHEFKATAVEMSLLVLYGILCREVMGVCLIEG